jgi:hypothetical protein
MSDEGREMIYALAISVALLTVALVTLAGIELVRSLQHWAQRRRNRTLALAQRLRSELANELGDVTAANRDLRVRLSKTSDRAEPGSESRLFGFDPVGDMHTQAIQKLRARLDTIDGCLADPEGQDLERLCKILTEITSEVSLLAAEIRERAGAERGQAWRSSLERRKTSSRRTA